MLADKFPNEDDTFEPDILIGSDYWPQLIQGKPQPIEGHPRLYKIQSKLGILLNGTIKTKQEPKPASETAMPATRNYSSTAAASST